VFFNGNLISLEVGEFEIRDTLENETPLGEILGDSVGMEGLKFLETKLC